MMQSPQEEKNISIALVAAVLFIIAFAVLVYFFFSGFVLNPEVKKLREGNRDGDYCHMVKLYIETNGREGWRDFRDIYYKDCVNR